MRTLKYFGIQAEKMVAFVFILGILYGIIFGGLFSETVPERTYVVVNYMLMMGVITIIVMQSSLVKLNMPLVLSLGCSRKEAFWGAQWMVMLMMVQFEFVCFLFLIFCSAQIREYAGFMSRILPFVCIAAGALSELMAVFVLKFGNQGTLIGILCMVFTGVILGFTMNDRVRDLDGFLSMFSGSFKMLMFLVLLVLYAFFTFIYYLVWKKYELKAF